MLCSNILHYIMQQRIIYSNVWENETCKKYKITTKIVNLY